VQVTAPERNDRTRTYRLRAIAQIAQSPEMAPRSPESGLQGRAISTDITVNRPANRPVEVVTHNAMEADSGRSGDLGDLAHANGEVAWGEVGPMTHANGFAELLRCLGAMKVEVARHPKEATILRHRPSVLGPVLQARLRLHRAALLTLLADGYRPPRGTDADHIFAERLGIADDLGLPTVPGSSAWLIAVGEAMGAQCVDVPPGEKSDLVLQAMALFGGEVLARGERFDPVTGEDTFEKLRVSCDPTTISVHCVHGRTSGRDPSGG
jgi:hypothetical protein